MAPLVALAGFMGGGKSTVGATTARLLGWRFVDLDEEFVRREGVQIADFFARHGEPAFRQREAQLLSGIVDQHLRGEEGLVVALGGGTLLTTASADLLEEAGGVVFMNVDAELAWSRAKGEVRPLARDRESFTRLLADRRALYERHADWVMPVRQRTTDDLAADIARMVQALGETWPRSWGLQLVSTARRSTIMGGEGSLIALHGLAAESREHGSRLFIITDANVENAWGKKVRDLLGPGDRDGSTLVIAPGEESKTVEGLARCWEWLASVSARRDDVVVALGGGVVGDLAGFAAATYQRGVALWQIPTSLLAQVDSSVGGKTAVNLQVGKNLVGAFYQPDLVVIDPQTLATLPAKEFADGLGEVVKYGLLSGPELFETLEGESTALSARDPTVLSHVVKSCVRYKAAVVEEDERDRGRRAVLNLGHTTAHALEAALGFGSLGHGEAVALGLLVGLAVSERILGLDPDVAKRTRALLADLGLSTAVVLPPASALVEAASRDKKVTAASAGFVGLRAVGEPVWGLDLPDGVFVEALEVIRA